MGRTRLDLGTRAPSVAGLGGLFAGLVLAEVAAAQEGPSFEEFAPEEAAPTEVAVEAEEGAAAEAVSEAAESEAAPAAPEAAAEPEPPSSGASSSAPVTTPSAPSAPQFVEASPTDMSSVRKLQVRRRVVPVYPDELQVLYKEHPIRCEALVWVDAKGSPQRISMVDCPDGFHLAALTAMQKWTWEKPAGPVPPGGVPTTAQTGFLRKNRPYYPGVTYFRSPERVTADPDLDVTLATGKMPRYPRQVNAGDDVCVVELVVDAAGRTRSPFIDDCAPPFHRELAKVVKTWKWTWRERPAKDETRTVVAEVVFRL